VISIINPVTYKRSWGSVPHLVPHRDSIAPHWLRGSRGRRWSAGGIADVASGAGADGKGGYEASALALDARIVRIGSAALISVSSPQRGLAEGAARGAGNGKAVPRCRRLIVEMRKGMPGGEGPGGSEVPGVVDLRQAFASSKRNLAR
jgi:hypothetical protein